MPSNVHPFSLSFQNQHTHHTPHPNLKVEILKKKTNMPINRIYPHYPKPCPMLRGANGFSFQKVSSVALTSV
jgi:hypothetical protein